MSALNQNIGYNQPTETGYYLGSDLLQTVEFKEQNGLKPSVTIYRDSLLTSKVDNGQLIAGRTYYAKYLNYSGGIYRGNFPFTFSRQNPVVEYDAKTGTTTAVGGMELSDGRLQEPATRANCYDLTGRMAGWTTKRTIVVSGSRKVLVR